MADLGESSQANTAHRHQRSSWICVALIGLAAVVLGVAFVARSWIGAVVGLVLLVAGGVVGISGGIMEDVK
jgi:predicted RND superfamily exporter protein